MVLLETAQPPPRKKGRRPRGRLFSRFQRMADGGRSLSNRNSRLSHTRAARTEGVFTSPCNQTSGVPVRRLGMPESRPMPGIVTNCQELRVIDGNVTWRILYGLTNDAVVILEIFEKRRPKRHQSSDRSGAEAPEEISARSGAGVMRASKQKRLEEAGGASAMSKISSTLHLHQVG